MNINIKATNMELTEAIRNYVNKRIMSFGKLLKESSSVINVEVGKTTRHHNKGDFFKAEINMITDGNKFYTAVEREDLYAAIDEAKENVLRELTRSKDKRMTLYKRGATSVKKMLKGITKRNPFTSKY